MYLSPTILGQSTIRYFTERNTAVVLKIGTDTFDRTVLAGLSCYNFAAAANLSRVLNAELQVKNTKDLFTRIHPERLVLPRLGAVSLAVLGAAFEAKGLGGQTPLESWFALHEGKVVTFATLKSQKDKQKPQKKKKARTTTAPPPHARAVKENRLHA